MERMRHVCFVGQGPNKTSWQRSIAKGELLKLNPDLFAVAVGRRIALTGSTGKKIAALLGLNNYRDFVYGFRRENLNDRWNGKVGKGDKFELDEGRSRAYLLAIDPSITKFVLLGSAVAKCFGFAWEPLSIRRDKMNADGAKFFLLPHPSGVNLWWNKPGNRERAASALKEFVR